MEVSEQLNFLLEKYNCTAKELAQASGMSVSVISRYRNGTRHPSKEQLRRLADGFIELLHRQGMDVSYENLFDDFEPSGVDKEMLMRKFNILVSILNINMSDFARFCSYDPSYISRLRSKQRDISDPEAFAIQTGKFLYQKYRNYDVTISALTGADKMPDESSGYIDIVQKWLCSGRLYSKELIIPFAESVDDIDIDSYVRSMEMLFQKRDTVDFRSEDKTYTGTDEIKEAELDFLYYALNSNTKNLYMVSNIPYNSMSNEDSHSNEWLYILSCIVKRGTNVYIINNFELPVDELLIKVRKMIPLYMTGNMHSYYIPGLKNNLHYFTCCCTDDAVMYGDGIIGFLDEMRYKVTCDPSEVEYRRTEFSLMLKKARPLMNVYNKSNISVFRNFLKADSHNGGEKFGVSSRMHMATMTPELLSSLLDSNMVRADDRIKIFKIYDEQREIINNIIASGSLLHEDIYVADEDEFRNKPVSFWAVNEDVEIKLYYNYEQYLEHQQLIKKFSDMHENYSAAFSNNEKIKEMSFAVSKGRWAVILKFEPPFITFVIRQPNVREALENIVLSINE